MPKGRYHHLPVIQFLLATEHSSTLLRDLVVILAAAAIVAVVLQRLKFATIPAYLLTGALIGPGALGFVSQSENVESISSLAIVLLLFGVGLHMDLSVLARGLKQMFGAAILATIFCTLALWPLGFVLGTNAAGALVVSMALSLSSTVVVLRVMSDRRELGHPEGRLTFGVLILQDLVAIVLLMLLPPLARWNGTGTVGVVQATTTSTFDLVLNLVANGLLAIGGIGCIIGIGKYVLPRLLTEAAKSRSSEVLVVLTTAAALGAAALTQYLIDNAAIGAFLAGFLLSSTPFRHQLSSQVGAVRDVFSAVFFTAIGMSVSIEMLLEYWPVILFGTLVMLIVKAVLMGLACWIFGATGNVAFKSGMALSQAGEFSALMAAAAAGPALGLISNDVVGQMVAIIVLSLIVTPNIIGLGVRINQSLPRIPAPKWAKDTSEVAPAPTGLAGGVIDGEKRRLHAIIAGFGLVGRAVADELKRLGGTYVVVDLNPATYKTQRKLGRAVVFGDISNEEVLETAGIHFADLLLLTIPDEESVLRACRVARKMKPDIFIIARANFVSQGVVAAGMGADGVVVEEMATAKEMERLLEKVIKKNREG